MGYTEADLDRMAPLAVERYPGGLSLGMLQEAGFELSEDEMRLDWSATVIDPVNFTEPVTLPIVHFEFRPGVRIRPYNCTMYPGQG